MNADNLKNWVCLHPFKYMDVQSGGKLYMCCPSWLPNDLTQGGKLSITEGWNSELADNIRDSVTDGSYSYCNHNLCPDLSNILKNNKPNKKSSFVLKEDFVRPESPSPEQILFGQDRSCNLKCPSCRFDLIPNSKLQSEEHIQKQNIQSQIEDNFSESIKIISLTGSGDPIYSKLYRSYLQNFDVSKYPNLKEIHIITNGVLLDQKMWESFACKDYITLIDISFDAGTKNTYENITRLGGDWDKLTNNLKFLANLQDGRERAINLSYVVTQYNYKEMHELVTMASDIFSNRSNKCLNQYFINFRQIVYWETGAYTKEQVKEISVFEPDHPEHKQFLQELQKITSNNKISHNFHHLLK